MVPDIKFLGSVMDEKEVFQSDVQSKCGHWGSGEGIVGSCISLGLALKFMSLGSVGLGLNPGSASQWLSNLVSFLILFELHFYKMEVMVQTSWD